MMPDLSPFWGLSEEVAEPHPSELVTGRMISLRFITSALRRRRRFWLTLAAVGLIVGAGYHLAVSHGYSATSTLYLAHAPGSEDDVDSANDLALVRTVEVGEKAAALLGQPDLSPLGLLGNTPAKAVSDNVMVITISGPTQAEAVKRVNAVTQAYLAFRSEQYNAQNQAIVTATNAQITKLQDQVSRLTSQINGLDSSQSEQLTNLVGERTTLQSQINTLQQTVQTDDLDTLSVSRGSRVITPGTPAATSRSKEIAIDGASGLVGGLAVGVIIVVLEAVLSDRLWRREDVAAALGAPVELSISRPRRRWLRRSAVPRMAARPRPEIQTLANYLDGRLAKRPGDRQSGLLVAVDNPEPIAAAAALLAARMAGSGQEVVLVDATVEQVLGRAFNVPEDDTKRVSVDGSPEFGIAVSPKPWSMPPKPWGGAEGDGRWGHLDEDLSDAAMMLVMATVDPAYGASHLRQWGAEAVVTVTAGRSTAQRINSAVELLDDAGIAVTAAVLLGADARDESIGLPDPVASRAVASSEISSGMEVRWP